MTDNFIADEVTRYQLTMTDEGRGALTKAVTEFLQEMFKEKTVIIDCPYAEAVEFGTTPSKGANSNYRKVQDPETGEYISEVKLKFRKWIGEKEGLTGKKRAKKGDAIYHHVMEKGAAPHPYIRPAIEDLTMYEMEDIIKITGIDDPAEACVYFLATKMQMYLEQNESIVTGTLKDSIKVVPRVVAERAKDIEINDSKYNWKPGQARV